MKGDLSDTEIIKLVLGGDSASFTFLVERYQGFVFTLALRFTKHREDAEEVAQDIFVKTFRSLADFRGNAKFSTWLYAIACTTSITFLRKKRFITTAIDDERTFIQLENQDGGFNANIVEQKSKIASLNEAIKRLSPDDAQVITLFYKGEQSLEEIGHILALEINTVKVRLHRARHRLKEQLEKHLKQEIHSM